MEYIEFESKEYLKIETVRRNLRVFCRKALEYSTNPAESNASLLFTTPLSKLIFNTVLKMGEEGLKKTRKLSPLEKKYHLLVER